MNPDHLVTKEGDVVRDHTGDPINIVLAEEWLRDSSGDPVVDGSEVPIEVIFPWGT